MRVQIGFSLNGYFINGLALLPTAILVLRHKKKGIFRTTIRDAIRYVCQNTSYNLMRHIIRYHMITISHRMIPHNFTRYKKMSRDATKISCDIKSYHMIVYHIRRGGELRTWRDLPRQGRPHRFFFSPITRARGVPTAASTLVTPVSATPDNFVHAITQKNKNKKREKGQFRCSRERNGRGGEEGEGREKALVHGGDGSVLRVLEQGHTI